MIVAFNVTDVPTAAGFGDAVTPTVAIEFATVTITGDDVLVPKFKLPS